MRDDRWVIPDHVGKRKKLRLVPVPGWVKDRLDLWTQAAKITEGKIFRAVRKNDKVSGASLSTTAVWKIVLHHAREVGIERLAPHDLRRYAESEIMPNRDSKMPSNPRESCRSSIVRPRPCGIIRCASLDMDEAQHSPSIV
ncbi:MAG: hypothetical protein WCA20_36600 [Candidatus Sulfotelmatobacter sp.]